MFDTTIKAERVQQDQCIQFIAHVWYERNVDKYCSISRIKPAYDAMAFEDTVSKIIRLGHSAYVKMGSGFKASDIDWILAMAKAWKDSMAQLDHFTRE